MTLIFIILFILWIWEVVIHDREIIGDTHHYIYIHTMAVMQAEESYENLANSFQSVFGEINNMVKNSILPLMNRATLYSFIFAVITRYVIHHVHIYTHNKISYRYDYYVHIITLYFVLFSEMLLELLGLNAAHFNCACVCCNVVKHWR